MTDLSTLAVIAFTALLAAGLGFAAGLLLAANAPADDRPDRRGRRP